MTRIILIAAITLTASQVAAEVPGSIPLQGYLTDDEGLPIDDTVVLDLTLYAGNTELYDETQSVAVDHGVFVVYFGEGDLDLAWFRDHDDLSIGVAVDGGAELTPRFDLGTAPFAAFARFADSAATAATVTGQVAWTSLQGVPAALADGDDDVLGGLTCSDGQVPKRSGSTWTCGTPADTLAGLSCGANQVPSWSGAAWTCANQTVDTDTTYSAGAGLTLTNTTFAVQTSVIQARVTGTCSAGQAIRTIDALGAVACETDDNTLYTAGAGLALSAANQFSVAGVTSAMIVDATIVSADIFDGAIASVDIADGAVASIDIADGTIASVDISDGAVASIDIADGAIASVDISNGSITTDDLATGAVGTTDLADGAVTSVKLAADAVTSAKIDDSAIQTADLGNGAVDSAKIASNAVTRVKISGAEIGLWQAPEFIDCGAAAAITYQVAATAPAASPTYQNTCGCGVGSYPNCADTACQNQTSSCPWTLVGYLLDPTMP